MTLFSVLLHFSLLQIADAMTSDNLVQPDDPRVTQFIATHDRSKRYYLRHNLA